MKKERAIYNARQLSGAAIIQTFDYMIREGVEYGYLTTVTSLRMANFISHALQYHRAPPQGIKLGEIARFPRSTPGLLTSNEMPHTPPGSTYIPSSPLSSAGKDQPRQPRRLRNRCASPDDLPHDPASDSSDGGNKGWKWGDKRLAVVMSPPQPPPAKRQQPAYQSHEERRRNHTARMETIRCPRERNEQRFHPRSPAWGSSVRVSQEAPGKFDPGLPWECKPQGAVHHGRVVHYLLLSWAGDGVDPEHFDIYRDGKRLQKELGQYGVIHGDIRLANVVYNAELGKPMLIDFDQARLNTRARKRKSIAGFSRTKPKRLMQN
ncbi:conserved hypothetical protein [Coccidioides posadasii str. Silveira]|uniref:Uncharacterized protein n=1 Tax=Coccidioides posadasii (strain RMSCC 757 / Silveira) TaxID=443226 RepID=E9D524_COCPS|nr:conserved hypothetical protein [Coccidioides posadasii str. Silveira]